MQPLWQLLEDRCSVSAVDVEWRRWLGAKLPEIRRWLRRRADLARSIPLGDGTRLRVIAHADDDVVGVDDNRDATVAIAAEDRVVQELDLDYLSRDMATVLDLEGTPETIERGLIRLGVHHGVGGTMTPVFFGIAQSPDALVALASRCVAREVGQVVLITPTARLWTEPLRSLLKVKGSHLIAVGQLFDIRDAALCAVAPLASLVTPPAIVSRDQHASVARFPTPPRSTWRDVRMKFFDGETVSIKVGSVTQRCTYLEMGFADKRRKQPNLQWELLRTFALNHGELTWTSRGASRRNQARCRRLAKTLRAYFGIAGEPIVFEETLQGWRVAFGIESD